MPRAQKLSEPVVASLQRDNAATSLLLSVLFHGAIIGASYFSWPFLQRDEVIEPPLIVDLVPIDEITAAPPRPAPKVEDAPEPDVQSELPPPDEPMPLPDEAVPKPEEMPPPPTEDAKPERNIPSPPPPKPKPPKKKSDIAQLQQLLKDMRETEEKQADTKKKQGQSTETSRNIANTIGERATMTELDAIRRHFEGCWRIDPGKEGLESLSAEIRVFIGPDGSVQRADILDMARYFMDPQFRSFANSARIAVLGCNGVPVTPRNYDQLKEMVLNFSPQGRIN